MSARAVPDRILTPSFAALWIAALLFFTAGGTVLPIAGPFATGPLHADPAGVGIAIGIYAIAGLVLRPVVGRASDRYGRRPLLLIGGVITLAALALHLVVTTLPLFIVARAMLGIGEAFFFIAALAAITDLAPEDRQGEAINIGSLSVYIGLAVGPLVGEAVLGATGFSGVWLTAAGLTAIAVAVSWFVPESAPVVTAHEAGAPRPPSGRLLHPAALFPGVLILAGGWGMAGFLAFLPLLVRELDLGGSSVAFAIYALVVIGLRIAFVKLPDQVGAARLSLFSLVAASVGLAMIGLIPTHIGLFAGTVVFASGIAFLFPGLVAVAVGRADASERGSVVGTASLFLDLSFGLAPAVLGVTAGAIGYGGTFVVSAVVAAAGAVLLVARRDALARPVGRAPADTLVA